MGREIRRVPPNWQHPIVTRSNGHEGKQPMFDETYKAARDRWVADLLKWEAGERPTYCSDPTQDFWEWDGAPPDREYYRPWADDEATWFQLWETVTEGTPVSPPFATKEELAQYLAEYGDEWDQQRVLDPWPGESRVAAWGLDRARAFVDAGWAPSFVVTGGQLLDSKDVPLAAKQSSSQ